MENSLVYTGTYNDTLEIQDGVNSIKMVALSLKKKPETEKALLESIYGSVIGLNIGLQQKKKYGPGKMCRREGREDREAA